MMTKGEQREAARKFINKWTKKKGVEEEDPRSFWIDLLGDVLGMDRITDRVEFRKKLASLQFLDPACGSGNFLTETYICLRRLENRVIADLTGGQLAVDDVVNPKQVLYEAAKKLLEKETAVV